MKIALMAALLAGSVAVAVPASAATNLLTNGSFENGLTGWNVTTTGFGQLGYSAPVVIKYNQSSDYPTGAFYESVPTDDSAANPGFDAVGSNFLYLSSDIGSQTISQAVTLQANTSYTFGFDYYLPQNGYNNPNGATFSAALNGSNFAAFSIGSQPATDWLTASAAKTFTTTQSGTFLFSFAADGYTAKDIGIDRVYLAATSAIPSAVPEPASWALMVGGFGLVGGQLRRRRSVAALAA